MTAATRTRSAACAGRTGAGAASAQNKRERRTVVLRGSPRAGAAWWRRDRRRGRRSRRRRCGPGRQHVGRRPRLGRVPHRYRQRTNSGRVRTRAASRRPSGVLARSSPRRWARVVHAPRAAAPERRRKRRGLAGLLQPAPKGHLTEANRTAACREEATIGCRNRAYPVRHGLRLPWPPSRAHGGSGENAVMFIPRRSGGRRCGGLVRSRAARGVPRGSAPSRAGSAGGSGSRAAG